MQWFENGLSLTFDDAHGGTADSPQLWRMHFRDGTVLDNTACAVPEFHCGNGSLRILWKNGGLSAEASVRVEDGLFHWGLQLHAPQGVVCVEYPILGAGEDAHGRLYLPWQTGLSLPDAAKALEEDDLPHAYCWLGHERKRGILAGEYPGVFSMQLVLLESSDHTRYFAAHDGGANYKRFGFYPGCRFILKNYPEREGAVDYTMPYDAVSGVVPGNWEEAAIRYRRWAEKQFWCAGGRSDRRETAEWAKNTSLWFWNWQDWEQRGDPEKLYGTMAELKARTGCTPALHWYGWNNQRSDTDYPKYEVKGSALPRLRKAAARFREMGVHVLPYLNGRLWNIDTDLWWSRGAARWACRYAESDPEEPCRYYIEPYRERPFVPMCPATEFWQDTMRDKVRELLDYGFDGAYLDQISSAAALVCRAGDHGHHEYGSYFADGYCRMLAKLHRDAEKRGKPAVFTSESVIECYIGAFDLFLGYQCACIPEMAFPNSIPEPLFSMVYHAYIPLYGTGTSIEQKSRFYHGQSLDILNGVVPSVQGYYSADAGKYPEEVDFLTERCRIWRENRDFFTGAERRVTPRCRCGNVEIDECGRVRVWPAVELSLWEKDGRSRLIAVNHTAEEQTFTVEGKPERTIGAHRIELSDWE